MTVAAEMPRSARRQRAVAAHTRTEVLGLAMLAGAVLFLLAAGLVSGLPLDEAVFLLPMILAPAIGAFLAWRFSTWGRVVGLLLGIATAAMTFWLGFGIMVPASFVEFTAATGFLLGVILLLYGGIASLVRRNDVRDEPARSEVLLGRAALGIVVLALVVSLPLWLVNRTTVDAAAAEGLPEVVATNFAFDNVTVPATSDGASVVVRNRDPFLHTFTIDELGIDVELLPGSASVVELPATPGTWTYYCIPHSGEAGAGEDDMAATLTIE